MRLATPASPSPAAGTSTATTVAPSRARVSAIAAPMPRAAPVTTATRPASGRTAASGSCRAATGAGPAGTPIRTTCPSTYAERADRKNRTAESAAAGGASGRITSRFAVAPARTSLAAERTSPSSA